MIPSNDIEPFFPYDALIKCTVHLHELGLIQPNSHIHKDRHGHFVNTAQGWTGAQAAINWFKGHTITHLIDDMMEFTSFLYVTLEKVIIISQITLNKPILPFLEERIGIAIGSERKGLIALKNTYITHPEVVTATTDLLFMLNEMRVKINQLMEEKQIFKGSCTDLFEADSQKLQHEVVSFDKYIFKYSCALYYNHAKCFIGEWNWQDEIGDFAGGKLYLGILPSKSPWQDSLAFMKKEGITDVLSVTEVFENTSPGLLLCPLKPKELLDAGIAQIQIPAPDFGTVPMELLERAIDILQEKLAGGKSIYVHCKAGRSRSALVMMCYFIKYQNKTAEESLALIQSKRKQVGFRSTSSKWGTLKEFEAKYPQTYY